jgi:hypothetical protein
MKTYEDPSLSNRYSVRFDESRRVVEFLEADIIGPGFQTVNSVHLQPGQVVFVTHNQREMQARVIRHDFETQDVLLRINEVITRWLSFATVRFTNCGYSQNLLSSLSPPFFLPLSLSLPCFLCARQSILLNTSKPFSQIFIVGSINIWLMAG